MMNTNKNKSRKKVFSEWLEQLQQESWQLELLISGLALFGIWESRSTLYNFEYYIDANVVNPYIFFAEALLSILWTGWAIFFVNLLAHIIVRGLWIGAIGLRYVSGDIDYDELNYSEVFRRYFKKRIGSFDDYIERLEKLSSVLFSFTFLLFFLFFSFVVANIFFGVTISTINSVFYPDLDAPSPFALIFGSLFYGLGLLVVIDFFTLGGFKKVKDKTFSKTYLALYRFYSTISLSFIYRPLLLNFIDDKYTRRLFFLAFPYALVMLLGLRLVSLEKYSFIPSFTDERRYYEYPDKFSINWNNYDDLRYQHHETFSAQERPEVKSKISIASLNKYELENNYASLFLSYERHDSKLLARQNPDFTIFNKTGLRHSIFSKGVVEDETLEKFTKDKVAETKVMFKVIKDEEDAIDSLDAAYFATQIVEYRKYTLEDGQRLRSEITDKYEELRRTYSENKIKNALDAIYSNYKIWINDVDYTDSTTYYFYTHHNQHEQGLKCNIPLKNLESGDHLIMIEKSRDNDDCTTDCPSVKKYLPFRKI